MSQNLPAKLRKLFGTDGVRGVANTELSPALAMALGAASAHVLTAHASSGPREVVVGRDPRRSGDLLEAALVAGLLSQGVDVLSVGVLPTPGVAYITMHRPGALAGVVLSASHNPMADNGIKFFGPDGRKLPDDVEAEIEAWMVGWEARERPSGAGVGRIVRSEDPVAAYVAHLVASAGNTRLNGLRLVLDCANGAASCIAGEVFIALGAQVELLSCEPDGVNINEDCGSLHPEKMAQRVRESGADAGIAFDGDADRAILADGTGAIFDGDRVLCAAGIHRAKQGLLPGRVVVGTIMSNLGLEEALSRYEIRLVRAPVGDRYVTAAMNEHGAALGGEKSGHILFPDISATGDGILTAIQTLRLCVESGRSLADWAAEMREFPQRLVSVRVRERDGWSQNPAIAGAIRAAEARLGDRGRINVRPSGTEKLIRVMVEGPAADEVETVAQDVADVIRTEIGA